MENPSPQSSFVVRAAGQRRMRWKNGAGWTSEILRAPDVDDWDWRLSIAEIEADAPFSAFPGVDRCACASTMARSARCIRRTTATRSPGNGRCSVNWSMARPATST